MDLTCANITQILQPPSIWERTPLEKLISELGYIASSMAISIHAFVHFTTDIFQNFAGHLLVSNCVLLLIQYCFSMCVLVLQDDTQINAFFKKRLLMDYDYYITVYIWSVLTRIQFVMAYDLWKCLKTRTTHSRFARQHTWKFVKYSIICWFSPFLEWGLIWLLGLLARKYLKIEWCLEGDSFWAVFMVYFAADFSIMIANISFFILCFWYIYRTKSSVKAATRQSSNFWFYMKICGRLFVMSEVNYTLLILANHFRFNILRIIFNNFMAYHGAIVFSAIVLKKSVMKYSRSVRSETENTGVSTVTATSFKR